MTRFLASRLAQSLLVIALVAVTTFTIMHAAPGGPSVLADPKLSAAERDAIARQLGLDAPAPVQFTRWVGRALQGDLGSSFLYQAPALDTIADRLPNTVMLAGAALLFAIALALPAAMIAGSTRGSPFDRIATRSSVVGSSLPVFWLGVMLILVFSVKWRVLPAGGAVSDVDGGGLGDRLRHLLLPAIALATAATAELFRYARAVMADIVAAPWWRAGRARGMPATVLLWRHAARHVLVTALGVIGLQLPRLVGGAAITETVFSWPGMGRLGVEAALARDYPLVMAVTLVVALGVAMATLLVDLAQLAADPRLRRS